MSQESHVSYKMKLTPPKICSDGDQTLWHLILLPNTCTSKQTNQTRVLVHMSYMKTNRKQHAVIPCCCKVQWQRSCCSLEFPWHCLCTEINDQTHQCVMAKKSLWNSSVHPENFRLTANLRRLSLQIWEKMASQTSSPVCFSWFPVAAVVKSWRACVPAWACVCVCMCMESREEVVTSSQS